MAVRPPCTCLSTCQALGCDFYVITGHKLYGPSGSGALYARAERQAEMQPFKGGGDMIRTVAKDEITYNDGPMKFEAGTPNIVQMIGLGAAIDYLTDLGMENVAAHERMLRDYARERLDGLNWLTVYGKSAGKGAIFSFNLEGGAHPHDISTIVDRKGVAVRAGHHCAQPLMTHLGVPATCRASFGLYNTREEVDKRWLRRWSFAGSCSGRFAAGGRFHVKPSSGWNVSRETFTSKLIDADVIQSALTSGHVDPGQSGGGPGSSPGHRISSRQTAFHCCRGNGAAVSASRASVTNSAR